MGSKTVQIATHPDLVSSPDWSEETGKSEPSLKRDAREGRGPKRIRIGNRAYYWRSQCDDYLRQLFEAD